MLRTSCQCSSGVASSLPSSHSWAGITAFLPLDLASRWLLHERTSGYTLSDLEPRYRMACIVAWHWVHLPWRSSRLWSPYRQCVLAFIFGPATNQRPCTLWVLSHSWAWPASSSVHEPFATGIRVLLSGIASSRHASLPSGTYTRRTYWACACFTDHVLDALVVDDISTGDSYYVISSAVLGFGVQELFSASAFGMSTHHASDPIRSYTFTGEGRL